MPPFLGHRFSFGKITPIEFAEPELESGANSVCVIRAQGNCKMFGACEKDRVNHTGNPNKADIRKSIDAT